MQAEFKRTGYVLSSKARSSIRLCLAVQNAAISKSCCYECELGGMDDTFTVPISALHLLSWATQFLHVDCSSAGGSPCANSYTIATPYSPFKSRDLTAKARGRPISRAGTRRGRYSMISIWTSFAGPASCNGRRFITSLSSRKPELEFRDLEANLEPTFQVLNLFLLRLDILWFPTQRHEPKTSTNASGYWIQDFPTLLQNMWILNRLKSQILWCQRSGRTTNQTPHRQARMIKGSCNHKNSNLFTCPNIWQAVIHWEQKKKRAYTSTSYTIKGNCTQSFDNIRKQ